VDSVREELGQPMRLARLVGEAMRAPARAATYLSNLGRTIWELTDSPAPAPWNTPVTRHRRWASARVPIGDVRAIRAKADATLNDVVLAACSGALRGFLGDHGERARPLKAMVPVSRRSDDERGDTLGNRVSLIVVDLPLELDDARERLAAVHEQTSVLKGSGLVEGAEAVLAIADQVPLFAAPLTRFVSRRIPMNLVITNIPGPPIPLYLRGARLLEVYPYVEVVDNEGLTIAVLSYDDTLFFGLTSDRDVVPDLDLLAAGIEQSFVELASAVGRKRARKAARTPAA
jgi:WS/DGAT/MGAT family acyltransferase